MSYTTTLYSDYVNVNPDGDTFRLLIVFTTNKSGSDASYNIKEKGIVMESVGTLESSYDFEEGYIAPATFEITLGDTEGFLDDIFFGTTAAELATEKQAKVTIQLNGSNLFNGYILEDSIYYDVGNRRCRFTSSPRINLINQKQLYADDFWAFIVSGISTAPTADAVYSNNSSEFRIKNINLSGGSGDLVAMQISGSNDPNSSGTLTKVSGTGDATISFSSNYAKAINPFGIDNGSNRDFIDILQDVFQIVNASLTYAGGDIVITNNRRFRGEGVSYDQWVDDFEITDLYFPTTSIYFNNLVGVKNCGDLLKRLAFDFGCFTGMTSEDQAYFTKLFYYDSGNTQTVEVLQHEKLYRYSIINYVKAKSTAGLDPNEPYEAGEFRDLENNSLDEEIFLYCYSDAGQTPRGTMMYADGSAKTDYYAFQCSGISTYPESGDVYSNNGSQFELVGVNSDDDVLTGKLISGSGPSGTGTLSKVSGSGDPSISFSYHNTADENYFIYSVQDDEISSSWDNNGQVAVDFWYNYRSQIQNSRIDKFRFKGVDYDLLKNFNYDGGEYQIILLKIDFTRNTTECEALYLGVI